jgi:hypothetical protein
MGENGVQQQHATTAMEALDVVDYKEWTWLSPPATYHTVAWGGTQPNVII